MKIHLTFRIEAPKPIQRKPFGGNVFCGTRNNKIAHAEPKFDLHNIVTVGQEIRKKISPRFRLAESRAILGNFGRQTGRCKYSDAPF